MAGVKGVENSSMAGSQPSGASVAATSRPVFISYASADAAVAQNICSALEAAGISCWIAPRDVAPGTLYGGGIVRAIDESTISVLILSKDAAASAHVGKELERAASKRHPIVALRIDTAPLTPDFEYFLNSSQWIDVGAGGTDTAIGKVVEAVARHLGAGTAAATTPAPQAPVRKASVLCNSHKAIAGVVACIMPVMLVVPAANAWGCAEFANSAADQVPSLPADSVFSINRQVTKLAEGVYTIRHRDPFPGWVHGNTTVIIGTREVLVVDSCQLSDCAREDIAQIREWTDKPVRYLINTHWHMDHTGGNKDYAAAFPSLAIIAHSETKKMMDSTRSSLLAASLKDAAASQARLRTILESGRSSDGTPITETKKTVAEQNLSSIRRITAQMNQFVYQGPTLTFDHEVKVDLGNREVQIKHLGRGNTAGDAVAFLPKERIVIVGDLLDHPVPYAFDGYPSEWVQTLTRLAHLDAATIVPGHGDVQHDKTFLYQVVDLMNYVIAEVSDALNNNDGATLEDVKRSLDLKSFRQAMAGNDKDNAGFFDSSIGSSFVELAYREAKQR